MHSFRSGAHTGENRCWPCTVTNLVIAVAIAGGLALFSPVLGLAFLVAGVAIVAFVGYLVPGTPTLTRRYFPKRVLAWFGKAPPASAAAVAGDPTATADGPAATDDDPPGTDDVGVDRLVAAGAISVDGDDELALDPSFADRWHRRIERLRDDDAGQREAFAAIVDARLEAIGFEDVPETGAFTVRIEDGGVSQWMSRAAFLADVASHDVLSETDPAFGGLSFAKRHRLLMGLRQFLASCPECDGPLAEATEATDSCCWSTSAITARCEDCGSRLYVVA